MHSGRVLLVAVLSFVPAMAISHANAPKANVAWAGIRHKANSIRPPMPHVYTVDEFPSQETKIKAPSIVKRLHVWVCGTPQPLVQGSGEVALCHWK